MSDEEISTDAESVGSILKKTAHGAGWIVGWRAARRLLGFVSILVLARILVPSDFGVVAVGSGLAGSLDALASLGIEDALVREEEPSRAHYDTGFTINLCRSAVTGAVLLAIAAPAGRFFGDLRLAWVIDWLAACTILGGFTNIGTVEFRRALNFNREFYLLAPPRVVGFLVTITGALVWHSYWALLSGIAASRVLHVVLSYTMQPYRPRITLRAWRDLANFSAWSWALGAASALRDRLDSFVLGRILGDSVVGYYSMGLEIGNLPATELVGPLMRAFYSGFAVSRNTAQNSGTMYLRALAAVVVLTIPLCVGISAIADPAVRLILGSKWSQVVPIIWLLAPFTAATAIGFLGFSLLSVYGLLRIQFWITLVAAAIRTLLLLVLAPQLGMIGALTAAIVAMMAEYWMYLAIVCRRFDVTIREIGKALWRPVLGAFVMAIVLWEMGLGWTRAPAISASEALRQIAWAVLFGATAYCGTVIAAWIAAGKPTGAEYDISSVIRSRLR